ncbi:hypothetical protein B0H17DRAFT_1198533 [Mycena rosella]|uniref:Uncharacterized protein n=1 Tax=Mycena rosella TaxID=1033263 RepID=A0AAD7DN57_MYCRO|nr:hypothetical protein B0H17DRAFT_1198533 [Mycena rosella]
MSISIRHASNPTAEIREAAKVLHEAFKLLSALKQISTSVLRIRPRRRPTLVEPFLLAHVRAAIIGGQLCIAQLDNAQIVGVAMWFGPGQKFLSSEEQRNAGWNQTMEILDEAFQRWWDNMRPHPDSFGKNSTDRVNSWQRTTCKRLVFCRTIAERIRAALISAVEDKAKLTSSDIFLRLIDILHIPIYKKLGFEVLGPEVVKTLKGQANAYCFRKKTAMGA